MKAFLFPDHACMITGNPLLSGESKWKNRRELSMLWKSSVVVHGVHIEHWKSRTMTIFFIKCCTFAYYQAFIKHMTVKTFSFSYYMSGLIGNFINWFSIQLSFIYYLIKQLTYSSYHFIKDDFKMFKYYVKIQKKVNINHLIKMTQRQYFLCFWVFFQFGDSCGSLSGAVFFIWSVFCNF